MNFKDALYKSAKSAKSSAITLALLALASCSSGENSGTEGNTPGAQTPTGNPSPVPAVALVAGASRLYLSQGQIALADLDTTIAKDTILTVSRQSGPPMQVRVGDGNVLYFLGPEEQFADSTTVLTLSGGGRPRTISFYWASKVGNSKNRITEPNESGVEAPADDIDLVVNNLPASGAVTPGNKLPSFTLKKAKPLDLTTTRISLNASTADLLITDWFRFDAATQTFTLLSNREQNFLDAVRAANRATITFSLSTAQYEDTYGFEQALIFANGKINVRILNANGSPATEFSGTSFVARGLNSGFSAIQKMDADGRLTFIGLPADTYDVSQVLLDTGVRLTGFSTLQNSSAEVNLNITKTAGAAPGVPIKFLATTTIIGPADNQQRQSEPQTPKFFASSTAVTPNTYKATATSAPVDTLVTTPVQFNAPKGSTFVGIKVDISTEEFPVYTGQQSIYNDVWIFDLQIAQTGASYTKTGKVNQTHSAAKTITIENCIDLTAAAANSDIPITGIVGAQNVADSALPTEITVSISTGCATGLTITKFNGSGSTPDGLLALWPRNTAQNGSVHGNLAGQYLSVPLKTKLPASFGIPSVMAYAPTNALLTEVELFQRTAAGDISIGKDYLSQASASKPGSLNFTGLRLNPTVLTPEKGRIQIVAIARGTIDGAPVSSQATPISINDFVDFTPLYLTSELAGYNEVNRYGTRETAGDAWATNSMAAWVFDSGLRYNDISAANVKQSGPPYYRSVLNHSGHSDGQQVDARYYDEEGKFIGALNGEGDGAAIDALGKSAQAEVIAKATSHPNLDKLIKWINQNRTNIATFAAKPTVRHVYVGNKFIASMLFDGQFAGASSTQIPGVGKWSASAKITPQAQHLHHWHVSTTNP